MDCAEVRELLDAYALGAADRREGKALEEHVADCVRCWDELNRAQRTAAMLALAVPIQEAPPLLRERILARAKEERRPSGLASGFRQLFGRRWPALAGALAAAAVAALALAAFLQVQMDDLRSDNRQLEQQVSRSDELLGRQRQFMALLTAPDVQEVTLPPVESGSQALGVYYWSKATRKGFLVCNNLPQIEEGQVYQAWFLSDGEAIPAGTFEYWNGIGELPMDLSVLDGPPDAIGLSIEAAGGSEWPSGEMVLLGSLPAR
ncbi:MAG: anti-sigma factor [Chloroflexi bacterium]|nr:anti-sigma factor [Chloroflexota bacterium]